MLNGQNVLTSILTVVNWKGKITSNFTIEVPPSITVPVTNITSSIICPNSRNDGGFLIAIQYNGTENSLSYFENFEFSALDIISTKDYDYVIVYCAKDTTSTINNIFFKSLFEEIQPIQFPNTTEFQKQYRLIKCNTDSDLSYRFYCVIIPEEIKDFLPTSILWLQIDYSL